MFYRETNWAVLKSFGFDYCGWWCVFVLWKMFSRETKGLFARCSGLRLITAAGGEGLIYIYIYIYSNFCIYFSLSSMEMFSGEQNVL